MKKTRKERIQEKQGSLWKDFNVWCGKTWVTSCELRVSSYELKP